MRKKYPLLISLLGFNIISSAQKPTIQDCLGAIPICTEIYQETNSPRGSGAYNNEINGGRAGGFSCMDAELNSIWYTFTVNNSGKFGFELTPNAPRDDYDWALFDITHASCEDIFDDPSLQVSCNAAGSGPDDGFKCNGLTGITGKSPYHIQGGGCDFFPPTTTQGFTPHNAFLDVIKGNTYVLVVSNWTGSTNGYMIDFSPSGDLGIFDDQPSVLFNISAPALCSGDKIVIEFSENIQIGSVRKEVFTLRGLPQNHDFKISSQAHRVNGTYDKVFELIIEPPIINPGRYVLEIKPDGIKDVLDLCGNPLIEQRTFEFEVGELPLPAPDLGPDTVLCVGDELILDISHPRADAYSWSDSSNTPLFTVRRAGTYIASVTNRCGTVSASKKVQYANCEPCNLFIPNGFTPNDDGINDLFQVHSDCELQEFTLQVFDRWGSLLTTITDPHQGWNAQANNGSKLGPGVFLYTMQYRVQELGSTFLKKTSGEVVILE